jgi:hypothetical protein
MASILKVDELRGIVSAGDITVTSEGGAATQSLQQGLAKHWVNFNQTGTQASRDSFNFSSLTDNGTGDTTVTVTNNFNNANYALSITSNNAQTVIGDSTNWSKTDPTSSLYRAFIRNAGNSAQDCQFVCCNIKGDLA